MKKFEVSEKWLREAAENEPESGVFAMNPEAWCSFCKNTGQHLCPDVAEPILIDCTNKKCPVREKK